jgi:V-type H+-transporting ATPase subunit a
MYGISIILLIFAIICIPLMLLVKPLCCRAKHHHHGVAEEVEFANIAVAEGDVNSMAINDNNLDGSDEVVMNRKRQLKSIDATLKQLAGDGGDHGFGEIFVHQMIETIEFALATVSNTASYLRLWALSLAHGQLTEVFMTLTFKLALTVDSFILTVLLSIFLWPVFWGINFFVLMCMDSLECALHTLRLHWVEFQNKFYKGQGYLFKPYDFKTILQQVLEN